MPAITITVTAPKPRKRPFLSIRRIGGLYHWRIGRTGGSIYRPKPLLACMALLGAATLQSCAIAPESGANGTYAVVLTAASGNEYVVDYGLSAADCAESIRYEWPDAVCINEGSN